MARSLSLAVKRQLQQHDMLAPEQVGLVAVSGGADSVALLLALNEIGCRLVVAHLDHGLRPESAADAEFVRSLCAGLSLPCVVDKRDVAAHRRDRKLSLEAAAREVRHAFLRQTAEREGASAIFLGHTADDQTETFLLRLIRGAGVAGLSGMRPKDGLRCRPMLGLWRKDVEAHLRRQGQVWREDASNRDPTFLRNRVRHELLPLLESLNPGIKQVLLREAQLLAERRQDLDAEVLRRLGLSARQIGAARAGKAIILKGGWRLSPPGTPVPTEAFDLHLPVPGEVRIPGVGRLNAELSAPQKGGGSTEYVDAARIENGLRVRNRRRGDRFVPLGMSSPKKLQDFFVDERVPRERRDRVPIVTSGDAIVWVAGMRIDDRFKVTPATTRAIRLRFEPE